MRSALLLIPAAVLALIATLAHWAAVRHSHWYPGGAFSVYYGPRLIPTTIMMLGVAAVWRRRHGGRRLAALIIIALFAASFVHNAAFSLTWRFGARVISR
ncbi:MAG: hypothetical protein M3Q69_00655 [Acidobacteriota bacterium]|nr:hypothetical protein [Acidobacteriota bacterium]